VSEPTRTNNQARGGGTGGRSDRDDEAAISSMSLSPPSGEKIKAAVEVDASNGAVRRLSAKHAKEQQN